MLPCRRRAASPRHRRLEQAVPHPQAVLTAPCATCSTPTGRDRVSSRCPKRWLLRLRQLTGLPPGPADPSHRSPCWAGSSRGSRPPRRLSSPRPSRGSRAALLGSGQAMFPCVKWRGEALRCVFPQSSPELELCGNDRGFPSASALADAAPGSPGAGRPRAFGGSGRRRSRLLSNRAADSPGLSF